MATEAGRNRSSAEVGELQQEFREGNGAVDGKKASFAAVISELSVGITREDHAAVAAEELDGGRRFEGESVAVERRSAHESYMTELLGLDFTKHKKFNVKIKRERERD